MRWFRCRSIDDALRADRDPDGFVELPGIQTPEPNRLSFYRAEFNDACCQCQPHTRALDQWRYRGP
jgi:hypothetical protein